MKNYYLLILLAVTLTLSSACTKPRFSAVAKKDLVSDPIFDDGSDNDDDFIPGEGDGENTDGPEDIPDEDDGNSNDNDGDNNNDNDNENDDNGNDGDDGNNNGDDDGNNNDDDSNNGDDDNNDNNNDDNSNDTPGEKDGNNDDIPGEDDGIPGEDDGSRFEVDLLCSNSRTARVGYNLKSAINLEVQLLDERGNIICKNNNSNIRELIVSEKILPINICAQATGLKYYVRLLDLSRPNKNKIDFRRNGTIRDMSDLINFQSQAPLLTRNSAQENFTLRFNRYRNTRIEVLYDGNFGRDGSDPLCDRRASPLIIKTARGEKGGIKLTSQKDGINFDILGENSTPRPHAKKRISWITKASYMFLVKPDLSGKVRGINEMFGDNTKGPDGQFADNGYAALAKYDENQDKVIDSDDTVYVDLRLWSDKNFDGRSQRRELITLQDAGLEAIDLMYDDSYNEVDQYGNQTKMKSVVKYFDGSYRLIFDLWFNYKGKRQYRRR